jgi:hypothetical protein
MKCERNCKNNKNYSILVIICNKITHFNPFIYIIYGIFDFSLGATLSESSILHV